MLDQNVIKKLAVTAGFDLCGIAPCRHLADNEGFFAQWLAAGNHSTLDYMTRNTDKRFDPRKLVEGAQSVVVCAVSYKNDVSGGYTPEEHAKVASYACTTDYHTTIRQMLRTLFESLRALEPDLAGRGFVDTAPLAEKQWAVEAGLGWIGRQSLLITPQFGSFVLLGELVLCAPVDRYDAPFAGGGCGTCRRCIDHCPNGAISEERTIDTRRCIACHTIEREAASPLDLHGWIFGCDCCQSCCPYNRQTPQHTNPRFDLLFDPRTLTPTQWQAMNEAQFDTLCGTTPLTRSGFERLLKNL